MQKDLETNFPSTKVQFLGVNEEGEEDGNGQAVVGTKLPLLQDVDANNNRRSDVWHDSWGVTWRDVIVLNYKNERMGTYNLTANDLGQTPKYDQLREMVVQAIANSRTAVNAWQNRVEPLDVSNDKFVSPADALMPINDINRSGSRKLTGTATSNYLDTTGDGWISPQDALLVINHLNRVAKAARTPVAAVMDLTGTTSAQPTTHDPGDSDLTDEHRVVLIDEYMANHRESEAEAEPTTDDPQLSTSLARRASLLEVGSMDRSMFETDRAFFTPGIETEFASDFS
jgi:hypothetical protein